MQAAKTVDRLDDRRVAAEEDAGVFRLERLQSTVRRAARLALGRPSEEFRIEPSLLQAALQAMQPIARKGDVPLFERAGQARSEHGKLAAGERDNLPTAFQLRRNIGERQVWIDEYGEEGFVEAGSQGVLFATPAGGEPVARNKKDHRLATQRRRMQRALPSLAGGDAALRIEIEENVVPSFRGEPGAQRHRLEIVLAGMTEEDARHK